MNAKQYKDELIQKHPEMENIFNNLYNRTVGQTLRDFSLKRRLDERNMFRKESYDKYLIIKREALNNTMDYKNITRWIESIHFHELKKMKKQSDLND